MATTNASRRRARGEQVRRQRDAGRGEHPRGGTGQCAERERRMQRSEDPPRVVRSTVRPCVFIATSRIPLAVPSPQGERANEQARRASAGGTSRAT